MELARAAPETHRLLIAPASQNLVGAILFLQGDAYCYLVG
jgi:hypothetical protein